MSEPAKHFKVEEVAAMYSASRRTVWQWMEDGQLGYFNLGRFRRVSQAALDKFNSSHTKEARNSERIAA